MAKRSAKVHYRGFTLEAKRERSLGGDTWTYWSAFRDADAWEFTSSFSDDTVEFIIDHLKEMVDDYYKNPFDYDDHEHHAQCLYATIKRIASAEPVEAKRIAQMWLGEEV